MAPEPRGRAFVGAALSALSILLVECSVQSRRDDKPQNKQARALPFDKYVSTGPDAPRLEGASGVLRYEAGCLYLEAGAIRTGLVMPDNYVFDGTVLESPRGTMRIGEEVSFSGGFVSEGAERYACASLMPSLLMADDTGAPAR